MAELYEVAAGWNNTGGYGTLTPQPKSIGMKAGRRTQTGDQNIYQDGFYNVELRWGFLRKSQYTALCSQFGVAEGTPSAQVTLRLPQNIGRAFADYNAVVILPDMPDDNRYEFLAYQEIVFRVVNVVKI